MPWRSKCAHGQYHNTQLYIYSRTYVHTPNAIDTAVDGDTDHKSGHAVVIQNLVSVLSNLDMKSNDGNVQDLKAMVIDMAHTISSLVNTTETLVQEVCHLKSKVQTIYDSQNAVVASITNYSISNGNIVASESSSSTHTRQVSTTVPACIIRSFWQRNKPNEDMGVSIKYLRALCD